MTVAFLLTPWDESPIMILILFACAAAYLSGCRAEKPSAWRQTGFWCGIMLYYVCLQSGFDYFAEHAFFMHRAQQAVLHHMAPFLVALSRPGPVLAQGTPHLLRRTAARLLAAPTLAAFIDTVNRPAIAAPLFVGLIILWLIPSVHFLAMLDWRLYRMMNCSMAVNGLMFWGLTLNHYALRPARRSPAASLGLMLAILPPQIVMGMLVFAASHNLYPIYEICGQVFPHLDPLADQQIGGLILWISGAMMSVIGIILVLRRVMAGLSAAPALPASWPHPAP